MSINHDHPEIFNHKNNNNMKQENWYAGQRVWDAALKPGMYGTIETLTGYNNKYPIKVCFEDHTEHTYDPSGRALYNVEPTLKPYPHRIEVILIKPDFEKGQIVLVRDTFNDPWQASRYVSKFFEDRYLCNIWGKNSDSIDWGYCIPFSGNEHLLLTTNMP